MPTPTVIPSLAIVLALFCATTAAKDKKDKKDKNDPFLPTPLRINCGGAETEGWLSDKRFAKGGEPAPFGPGHDVSLARNPAPAKIYESVRHRDHGYLVPVAPGRYRVRFHFTDAFDSGARSMGLWLNRRKIIDRLDVAKITGGSHQAVVFEAVAEVAKGKKLEIQGFKDHGNNFYLAGIEILPAADAAPLTTALIPLELPEFAQRRATYAERSKQQTAANIRALTGAPTRLVWLQGHYEHYTHSSSVVAIKVLDSEDAQGERDLLPEPGPFSKPLLGPDGKTVFFSDRREREIRAVDWDGTNPRTLGEGFLSDVWRDPQTGETWLYLRTGDGGQSVPIVRRKLSDPSVAEAVWEGENGGKQMTWLQLSADGRHFTDAFPWNRCGVADANQKSWEFLANGCWPGIAPDNSYRCFVFAGTHRHLTVFDRGGTGKRDVELGPFPGFLEIRSFHPRWSNDARFLTATAPQGGSELFLGKFDPKFAAIEKWVQVTKNGLPDLFGDAWIQPEKQRPGGKGESAPVATLGEKPGESWPGETSGLVWVWDSAEAKNEAPAMDGETRPFACKGQLRGLARFGSNHELLLDGGSFEADAEAGMRVTRFCRKSGEFSVEATIVPFAGSAAKPAPIISLGSNFALEQEGNRFAVRLQTSKNRENRQIFGQISPNQPIHLVVTYRDGSLRAYLNGQTALQSDETRGNLENWAEDARFILGDGKTWPGSLQAVAVLNQVANAEEAQRRHRLLQSRLVQNEPPTTVVEASLQQSTPAPAPAAIAPYRRALVENVYQVERVISGPKPAQNRVIVLQWAILDAKPLAAFPKAGTKRQLTLQPLAAHPQLKSEHRSAAHSELDAPVFFDARSHRR